MGGCVNINGSLSIAHVIRGHFGGVSPITLLYFILPLHEDGLI